MLTIQPISLLRKSCAGFSSFRNMGSMLLLLTKTYTVSVQYTVLVMVTLYNKLSFVNISSFINLHKLIVTVYIYSILLMLVNTN